MRTNNNKIEAMPVTGDDLMALIEESGVEAENEKQRVAGSVVMSLIRLSIAHRKPVELEKDALINSVRMGCQLDKKQITHIVGKLARKVHIKLSTGASRRVDFLGKGVFELSRNHRVKFAASEIIDE